MNSPVTKLQPLSDGSETKRNIRIRTYTNGAFKGRSYEINPDGTDGARIFKDGEKVTGKHRIIRRFEG